MTDGYNKICKELKNVKESLEAASKVCSDENRDSYLKAVAAIDDALNQLENAAVLDKPSSLAPGIMGSGSSAGDDEGG